MFPTNDEGDEEDFKRVMLMLRLMRLRLTMARPYTYYTILCRRISVVSPVQIGAYLLASLVVTCLL